MTKERRQQVQYLLTKYLEGNTSKHEEDLLFLYLHDETETNEWEGIVEELMAAEEEAKVYSKEQWQPVINEILRHGQQRKRVIKMAAWKWVAAASIILILGIGSYFFLNRKTPINAPEPTVAKTKDVEAPKTTKAVITLADGRTVSLDSIQSGTLATQEHITVEKTADGKIFYQPTNGIAQKLVYNTLTNPRGSKVIDMQFTDGSHVWLNAGSSVRFPVAFIGNERRVEITGEAYFEVAHDAAHPFIVSKGETSVTVLGTHFNVNAYDDEESLKVTLLEGSVRVSANSQQPTANSLIIKPGQQAVYIANSQQLTANSAVDLDEVMAWKNGYFSFANADLKTMMRQAARWYDVDVTYEGNIPAIQFSGEIGRTLTLKQFLSILEQTRIHYRLEQNKLVITP